MGCAQPRCLGQQIGFVDRVCPELLQRSLQLTAATDPWKAKIADDGHVILQARSVVMRAMADLCEVTQRCRSAKSAVMVVSHSRAPRPAVVVSATPAGLLARGSTPMAPSSRALVGTVTRWAV